MNLYFMGEDRLYQLDGSGGLEQYSQEGNVIGGQDNSLIGNSLQNVGNLGSDQAQANTDSPGLSNVITNTGTISITLPNGNKYFDAMGNVLQVRSEIISYPITIPMGGFQPQYPVLFDGKEFITKETERMPIKEERDPTAPVRRIMLED